MKRQHWISFLFFLVWGFVFPLPAEEHSLEQLLSTTNYQQLFLSAPSAYDAIWRDGTHLTELLELMKNPGTSLKVNFLIGEILIREISPFPEECRSVLGKAYAEALAASSPENPKWGEYQLSGDAWGFLFSEDDKGYLGDHFLSFGREAFPFLIPLLEDRNPVTYIGSSLRYEIRDFAAYYLAEITGYDLDYERGDPVRNARAMELFREKLERGDPELDPYSSVIRKLEGLLNCTAEEEPGLLEEIWKLTDPENPAGRFDLSLFVKDTSGKNVTGSIRSARGEVEATITLSRSGWERSLTFTPRNKENLYLLMRE